MSTAVTRASKGTVQIRSSNNRLQLRFSYEGIRHCLSLGLQDTKENRKAAQAKAKLIESDIAYDRFDILKYKRSNVLSALTSSEPLSQLDEVWLKFIEFKRGQCSPSTMEQMYKVFSSYMGKLPTYDLERSGEVFDWIARKVPPDSAKRLLTRLSACCKWAMQSGLIDSNPFQGLASQIILPKGSKGDEIDPFTAEERNRILEALKTDASCSKFSRVKHSHYWAYIYFAFYTGARTSEIIALQWRHIELEATPIDEQTILGRIRFEDAVVESADGRVQKKGLKTQERREFPINRQLYQFLMSIRPEGARSKDLLFCAPNGGWLHTSNFSRRVWKPLLEGLGIRHRKVYACRHTFITLALQAGMPIPDIAQLVGNSPKVILDHYAGKTRSLVVPEL
jgi:integrase